MDIKIREKLKEKIPHGELTRIAKENNLSRVTLYNWFRGSDSPKAEEAIINYVKNSIETMEEKQKTISEFINN